MYASTNDTKWTNIVNYVMKIQKVITYIKKEWKMTKTGQICEENANAIYCITNEIAKFSKN